MHKPSHRFAGAAAGITLLAIMIAGVSWADREGDHDGTAVTGIHQRQQFAAGEQIRVHDATLTDAFVAGGEVTFERVTVEDVYAAGGSIRLHGTRVQDLVVAGGELFIDASIEDDLVAAGGRIRLQPDATILGDVVLAGGDVELGGRIDGNVTAAAARLTVSGTIGGDLEVAGAELIIHPEARIAGRLIYRSEDAARIAPEAVISGGVERRASRSPSIPVWAGVSAGIALLVILVLGLVLLGAVMQALMPGVLRACTESMSDRAVASWLLGFAVLVAVPVAANIALITMVGAPLAVVIYLAYALTLVLALVIAANWVGDKVTRRWRRAAGTPSGRQQITRTALGMLLLTVTSLIPLIGWLVLLAVIPAGVGAVVVRGTRWIQGYYEPAPGESRG